jgi:hypothetical protein
MTDQEINIAIAEECGWKWYVFGNRSDEIAYLLWPDNVAKGGHEALPVHNVRYRDFSRAPDYGHDLNAIHAAWQSLDKRQKIIACSNLINDCGGQDDAVNANAAQKTKAFLRTIGKWKE